jgi:hypothetical protein
MLSAGRVQASAMAYGLEQHAFRLARSCGILGYRLPDDLLAAAPQYRAAGLEAL